MIHRLCLALATLSLLLCAVSCKSGRFYTVGIMNRSYGDVQDVAVQWGKDKMLFGNIMEGHNATKTPFFSKPPPTITLSWRSGDQECAMDIDTTNLVPDGFDGTLFLVIRGYQSVDVGAIKEGDRDAYNRLGQRR